MNIYRDMLQKNSCATKTPQHTLWARSWFEGWGAEGAATKWKIHACMEGEEEEVLTELMDGLCKFFARAGKERPPGSSSSETPRKRKAPPPTLPNVEQDVQQRT